MKNLQIYDEYTISPPSKEHNPSIDGASLLEISDVIRRIRSYSIYFEKHFRIKFRKWEDYDGYPFEDFYGIYYISGEKFDFNRDENITVCFKDTHKEDYDYIAMAARDTTTAYKRGKRIQPQETKFKRERAIIWRKLDEPTVWVKNEVRRLKTIVDQLDEKTRTLSSWADSDLNMQVFCSTSLCRTYSDTAIISNDKLRVYAGNGLTFEELKLKMKCTKCGTPASRFVAT